MDINLINLFLVREEMIHKLTQIIFITQFTSIKNIPKNYLHLYLMTL
jgi:hypothetical protein